MWVVNAYEKEGDGLVREHRLGDIDVALLRRLWERPDNDPMYESYPVTPEIANTLDEYVDEPLRLSDYDYFLEYMSE
jgi:hypothetical protein